MKPVGRVVAIRPTRTRAIVLCCEQVSDDAICSLRREVRLCAERGMEDCQNLPKTEKLRCTRDLHTARCVVGAVEHRRSPVLPDLGLSELVPQ